MRLRLSPEEEQKYQSASLQTPDVGLQLKVWSITAAASLRVCVCVLIRCVCLVNLVTEAGVWESWTGRSTPDALVFPAAKDPATCTILQISWQKATTHWHTHTRRQPSNVQHNCLQVVFVNLAFFSALCDQCVLVVSPDFPNITTGTQSTQSWHHLHVLC